MNSLGIMPNTLYKEFITNKELKRKIEVSEKISDLPMNKIDAILKMIDILQEL